jgi:hypothetical protein
MATGVKTKKGTDSETVNSEIETIDDIVALETDVEQENVQSETGSKSTKKNVKTTLEKKKKVFTDADYILCRSVCYGGLYVSGQSGNIYEFKDYGKDCQIKYRDLVTLVMKGHEDVFLPRFIILDEDFLEDFPTIKETYEKMYTRKDLLDILDLPVNQMRSAIRELPESTKEILEKMIATEIGNGHLDSISKVRALSEIFDSDFNLLSELFVK